MNGQKPALILTGALVALLAILTTIEMLRVGTVDPVIASLAASTIVAFTGLIAHANAARDSHDDHEK